MAGGQRLTLLLLCCHELLVLQQHVEVNWNGAINGNTGNVIHSVSYDYDKRPIEKSALESLLIS